MVSALAFSTERARAMRSLIVRVSCMQFQDFYARIVVPRGFVTPFFARIRFLSSIIGRSVGVCVRARTCTRQNLVSRKYRVLSKVTRTRSGATSCAAARFDARRDRNACKRRAGLRDAVPILNRCKIVTRVLPRAPILPCKRERKIRLGRMKLVPRRCESRRVLLPRHTERRLALRIEVKRSECARTRAVSEISKIASRETRSSFCRDPVGPREERSLSKVADVLPIDPLFHERLEGARHPSFTRGRTIYAVRDALGEERKKGSAKRLNAPLSSLRERTRSCLRTQDYRVYTTVGLEF